jgi:hypothetical protein
MWLAGQGGRGKPSPELDWVRKASSKLVVRTGKDALSAADQRRELADALKKAPANIDVCSECLSNPIDPGRNIASSSSKTFVHTYRTFKISLLGNFLVGIPIAPTSASLL